ncbi:MAG TPA: YkvA family protein [Pseudonocardiaceae bacterium]|nr:YkvA family protein [Pseudonocardiaceae bacterium]
MNVWWEVLGGVLAGLLLLWLVLLVVLWRTKPEEAGLCDALRLLADLIRLLRRLAADPVLPRGVRVRLALLLGYLALPIDLIPDFIPVLGYADDAIVVALALRSVVRRAGPDALAEHWPGTPEGLRTLHRLAQLPPPSGSSDSR